ncbi:hypothetical protein OROGR_007072 [Orobanche gracilis]
MTDSSPNDPVSAAVEDEENGEAKPWKLRPRKEVFKAAPTSKQETGAEEKDKKADRKCSGIKSQRRRGMVEGRQLNGGVEREGKRKVWISLSKEEIEEEINCWDLYLEMYFLDCTWSELQLTRIGV